MASHAPRGSREGVELVNLGVELAIPWWVVHGQRLAPWRWYLRPDFIWSRVGLNPVPRVGFNPVPLKFFFFMGFGNK